MRIFSLSSVSTIPLLLLFTSAQVHGALISTFDSGTDGWTVSDGAKNLEWNATGGNPGGFISAEEALLNNTWYFRSPNGWAGDWTSYIGGTVSFDLIDILKDQWDPDFGGMHGVYYPDPPEIIIAMDTENMAFWDADIVPISSDWTSFQVQLLESDASFSSTTTASFETIMANVSRLAIRGEYFRLDDKEGIDNVMVNPIPIPAAGWLFGSGLLGLFGMTRRQRS
jgi:hypothetical protein